jgi:immune inhibitor A
MLKGTAENGKILTDYPHCMARASPDLMPKIMKVKKMVASGADLSAAAKILPIRTFALILSRNSKRPQNYGMAPARVSSSGTVKALVLLVDFEENTSTTNKDHYEELLFSSGVYSTGSMRDYFKEVSYGNLDIVGDVFGWYRMPEKYEYYVDNKFGTDGVYPHNAKRLVEDAVHAANADVNFSDYDSDGDGIVDATFIVHAGRGAEETGLTTDIWSHRWNLDTPVTVDNVKVIDYTIEAEDGRIGLFCHEFVHVYNIPDLYDTDYDSYGIGRWCLMSAGSWGGTNPTGSRPIHPCAWVKKKLGWVNTKNPIANQNDVSLPDIESNPEVMRLWTNGIESKEYFLLENRQKKNFDSELPAGGLLIYHIDESQLTNSNQFHPLVGIEQADGERDLENAENEGDQGDVYRGTTGNTIFDVSTNPNSKSYLDEGTLVDITDITNSNVNVTFNVKVTFANLVPLPLDDELKNISDGGHGPLDLNDSRHTLVRHLQMILKILGFSLGNTGPDHAGIDGDFKAITLAAVKNFQQQHPPLQVDGKVGPLTAEALNNAAGI